MAENTEFDQLLREAFDRLAEPGDPAGVAEALRQRMAAGDTGTTVEGTIAPGFEGAAAGQLGSGLTGGALALLPWVAVVVGAGLLGTALGVGGVFGRTVEEVPTVGYTAVLDTTVAAEACPGGPIVATITAGTRVLAIARSEDGARVGIRNPNELGVTVWLDPSVVRLDEGAALTALPLGEPCPEVSLLVVTPEPSAPTEPDAPSPQIPQPGDTVAPTMGTVQASKSRIYNLDPVTIVTSASDDVGVTGVTITWSNQYAGSAQMTRSGSTWSYTFTPPTTDDGDITFTVQARDAAGNLSQTRSVTVEHRFFG